MKFTSLCGLVMTDNSSLDFILFLSLACASSLWLVLNHLRATVRHAGASLLATVQCKTFQGMNHSPKTSLHCHLWTSNLSMFLYGGSHVVFFGVAGKTYMIMVGPSLMFGVFGFGYDSWQGTIWQGHGGARGMGQFCWNSVQSFLWRYINFPLQLIDWDSIIWWPK